MQEFNQDALELFLYSAVERHHVYKNRQAGLPKPWSEDPIYVNYFFCNVFRQYDKCTRWIIKNVIPLNRWELIILYRYISTMDLFIEIEQRGIIEDLQAVKYFLADTRRLNRPMFNGCFLRNPSTSYGVVETWLAPFYIIKDIENYREYLYEVVQMQSLECMVGFLKQFKGTAGFMAYEYACDFEYSNWFNPTDKYSWANPGPGAERGMSLLLTGRDDKKFSKSSQEWLGYARELFKIMQAVFNKEFPEEDFSMREVEHWLCEFQKYIKYRSLYYGGPKVRHRKYNGAM